MLGAIIITTVLVAAFAYLLIEWWQIRSSEGARDELLQIAQEMLGSPKYTDAQKDMISDMLDEALDRGFMVQMVIRLPSMLWRYLTQGGPSTVEFTFDENFNHFLVLHQRCTAAANPFFAFLFRLELAVAVFFLGAILTATLVVVTAGRVAHKLSRSTKNGADALAGS